MTELDQQYGEKGLHIVTAYVQFQALEVIEKSVADLQLKLPVALDGFFDSRFTAPLLCCVWVIGVDGKVVHADQNGWEQAALKELKKVKYPRLGLRRVYSPNEEAAEAFGRARYADAWKLAGMVSESDEADKAVDQAEEIIERVEDMRDKLLNRADVHEICGRYELAIRCWEELRSHYKGLEDVGDPEQQIARIKAMKEYEPEMKARRAYIACRLDAWRPFENLGDDEAETLAVVRGAAEAFRKFADEHKGRDISAAARDMQQRYESWAHRLEGLDKPEKSD